MKLILFIINLSIAICFVVVPKQILKPFILKSVNPDVNLSDYIDVKVEAEIGKNVDKITSKIEELKTKVDAKSEESNRKIEELKTIVDAKSEESNKKIEEVNKKIDKIDIEFNVGKLAFGSVIAFLGIIIGSNAGTFIQDVVNKK